MLSYLIQALCGIFKLLFSYETKLKKRFNYTTDTFRAVLHKNKHREFKLICLRKLHELSKLPGSANALSQVMVA